MGFFDTIKNIHLFGRTEKGSLGLDIGSSSIKVVELEERGGQAHLLRYGTLALGPYGGKDIGAPTKLATQKLIEAIQTTFSVVGIKTKKVGISIPLRLSLIVTIEVPASVGDKLSEVIPAEARKYIPVSPQEVNIAWSLISGSDEGSLNKEVGKEGGKIRVLVAAIHNSTIKNYSDIAGAVGLSPLSLEIETFSAMRSLFSSGKETIALLDIGSEDSKIVMNEGGSVALPHTIGKGSHAITESIAKTLGISYKDAEAIKRQEGVLGSGAHENIKKGVEAELVYIFSEAKRAVDDFEKTRGKKITQVVLIGGGAVLKGIASVGKSVIEREVLQGDAFRKIVLPTEVPALVSRLRETSPEYAVSTGLALRAMEGG